MINLCKNGSPDSIGGASLCLHFERLFYFTPPIKYSVATGNTLFIRFFTRPITTSNNPSIRSSKQIYYNRSVRQNKNKNRMSREIPVGALLELRGSNEDWRVVSYCDNEMPKFCRQYMIMNTTTGATKRVFKHGIYEKDTSTY